MSANFYFVWLVPRQDARSQYDFSPLREVKTPPTKEQIMRLMSVAIPVVESDEFSEKNVSLKAVMRRGTELIGLFALSNQDGSGKELVKSRLGDNVAGWDVVSIGGSRAVIERNGESRELEVLKVVKK